MVLPDEALVLAATEALWVSQCTYRCVVLPDDRRPLGDDHGIRVSQCTYRCVVLPDRITVRSDHVIINVSMHLQVRGAP